LVDSIPVPTNLATNQYGVVILTVKGEWLLDGINMKGEVIEIANARKESYEGAGGKGKGYKPTDVSPATIEEDVFRREFTFNTLLWRMLDLANGPDKAEIIDFTGLGRQHLDEKLISTPVNPDKTFSDDPTRQLRVLKFLLRYDLKISPDVVASVKRNAHKLKSMPWEAVGNILIGDILNSPKAMTGIKVMRSLGILDVIVEMIKENPPFAAFLTKQLANGNHSVELLLELADLGVAGRVLEFLTPPQRERFKMISTEMSGDEAKRFLGTLRKPPVDNLALIQEFNLQDRDRGSLVPIARELLLNDSSLALHEVKLNDKVREFLRSKGSPNPSRVAQRFARLSGRY
jgi:tRNA nucleotidyltransferase/poly(A) polymerase